MGIFKYPAVFLVVPHTLFASVILGGRLKVFGMPDILQLLQNPYNSFLRPPVRLSRKQFSIFPCLVCRWSQHLIRFQFLCDLRRPKPVIAQLENIPYGLCRFFVYQPLILIFGILDKSERG